MILGSLTIIGWLLEQLQCDGGGNTRTENEWNATGRTNSCPTLGYSTPSRPAGPQSQSHACLYCMYVRVFSLASGLVINSKVNAVRKK